MANRKCLRYEAGGSHEIHRWTNAARSRRTPPSTNICHLRFSAFPFPLPPKSRIMAPMTARAILSGLALVSVLCLAGLGAGTIALAFLLIAWPFGLSPSAHPAIWLGILRFCVLMCAGFLIPGLAAVMASKLAPHA